MTHSVKTSFFKNSILFAILFSGKIVFATTGTISVLDLHPEVPLSGNCFIFFFTKFPFKKRGKNDLSFYPLSNTSKITL